MAECPPLASMVRLEILVVDWEGISSVLGPTSDLATVLQLAAETRCFFAGGGDKPPFSESDDEARIAYKRLLENKCHLLFL